MKNYLEFLRTKLFGGGNYFELPTCYGYVIWDKKIPEGLSFADCEMAWHSYKKAAKIFRYSAYLDKKHKFHPTQKPVALYKWLLKNYAKEGDKILDTHLGSGSIAIACHDMRFDLEAYELDADYYKDCMKRFNNHIAQTQLF